MTMIYITRCVIVMIDIYSVILISNPRFKNIKNKMERKRNENR